MTSSSTQNFNIKGGRAIFLLVLWTLLLTGCEGPSTTVLPDDTAQEEKESEQLSVIVPESSTDRLILSVNTFCTGYDTGEEGRSGTEAVTDPSVYIVSALRNSSYDVNQTGEIVEAVLNAVNDDPDICLVIACYGGLDEGTCASDTAAGAAVLLETAEVLSGFSGDTEIHFVFLPGGRSDAEHIYMYLSEVFTPDPDRLVGAVILGGLGLNTAAENELGCEEGRATFMAEQINRVCQADLGRECLCTSSSEGIQNALQRNLIPSVVYRQKEAVEAGTVLDCPSLINYDFLQESVDVLSRTLALLIGDTTPSMQARAHYTDSETLDGKEIFVWGTDDPLPFGESEAALETVTGLRGEQISENIVNNGKKLLGYSFSISWFGGDDTLQSDFYYLDDALQSVQIRASEAGKDYAGMCDAIETCYGEAEEISDGPYGTAYEWLLPMPRLHITLQPLKEGYDLSLTEYDTPVTVYPSDSLGCSRLESLYEQIIPAEDREHMSFEAYTDGYGATVGRLSEEPAEEGWVLGIDLDDALTGIAAYRDKLQTIGEIVRLYGEYLAGSAPAVWYDGFRSRFDGGISDFAAAFRLFALSDVPREEVGPAADPVRYFYDFDELVRFRDTVRDIR